MGPPRSHCELIEQGQLWLLLHCGLVIVKQSQIPDTHAYKPRDSAIHNKCPPAHTIDIPTKHTNESLPHCTITCLTL